MKTYRPNSLSFDPNYLFNTHLDCEFIRQSLNIPKWTLLGQSFGGFISTTYLSFSPSGLESVMMTGGLPPITASVDQGTY